MNAKTKMYAAKSRRSNRISAYRYWLAGLLLLTIVIVALEATNTTHLFHKEKARSGPIPIIAQPEATVQQPKNSQKSITPAGTPAGSPSTASNAKLISPYGTFVSNHHPGANGSPLTEESVCNTTPDAKCYIKLTEGNVVKTLPAQQTDANGATSWRWDVKQAGLTTGSWKVSAVASLGDQTLTTSDPVALEVQ